MRYIAAILSILLSVASVTAMPSRRELDGDVADSVMRVLGNRSLDPIEGIWQVAGLRSVIAVVSDGRDRFNLIAVDVDAPAVVPGTLIGTARPTAKAGTYDAKIYTKTTPEGKMIRKADFIITIDSTGGRMTLHHYYKGLAVRMWRSIPYLFGATLRNRDTRPEDIDGCLRIWPDNSIPSKPIVL